MIKSTDYSNIFSKFDDTQTTKREEMKRKADAGDAEDIDKKKLKKTKKAKRKEKQENHELSEKGDNLESSFASPEKKMKKKKKADKEKLKKQNKESESSEDEDKVQENSLEEDNNTGSSQEEEEEDIASTCWFEKDIEVLVKKMEKMGGYADVLNSRLPHGFWSEIKVGNHSPESCKATWTKISHVVKTHLTFHHVVMVIKDLLKSRNKKRIMKLLVYKFPDAPMFKLMSGYQCFTKERIAETPQRPFKDIGVEWKALTESERSRYQKKAEKINEELQKKQEEYIRSLSEEMRERYLEHAKGKWQKKLGKTTQKEFADAPKSSQSNSYQEYTKERFAEDPNITFTEIGMAWKSMSEAQKKPYQVRAVKINEQAKKELEKYVKSLTDEQQIRFFKSRKLTEKSKGRVKKKMKLKALSQRDFKRAELQYLKEEKRVAIKENPDLDEEEILRRLSEAFRSLDLETQKSYCRKAEISLQEQKTITEFYKNFESPLLKRKSTSAGTPPSSQGKKSGKKADSSDSNSDSSPDSEEEKKTPRKPPVMALGKKADSDSDSSSEDERPSKPPVSSPVKRKIQAKSSDSDSSSSSGNRKVGKSMKLSPKKVITSRKNLAKVGNVEKDNSSSDDSSDDEPETVSKKRELSPKKVVKKPDSSSSDSGSSEDEAKEIQKKNQAPSSPTKKSVSSVKKVVGMLPSKKPASKKPDSSSSESSSEEDAKETQKKNQAPSSPTKKSASGVKTPVKSPKKSVNSAGKQKSVDDSNSDLSDVVPLTQSRSPKKSAKRAPTPSSSSSDMSSSDSSSDESDNEAKGSQKKPGLTKTPQQAVKASLTTSAKSLSTPSSLKTLKKKQK